MKKMRTDEIAEIFEIILEKLKFEGIEEISIDMDYYWIIDADKWGDFENNLQPTVGSLVDDVQSLKLLLKDNERLCTFVDFDRLASVLRYISEKKNG